jgi:DNA-binding response OmpR family regulator
MGLQTRGSITTGRILVVDDDAGERDFIVASLRADGHDVDVSSSGIEALRLLGREWYDLIVSNLRMPELDGPSLYSAVSQRWPAQPPPLLFLAGLGGTSDYDGFLKVIRAHVLPKPFTIRALRRIIRQML